MNSLFGVPAALLFDEKASSNLRAHRQITLSGNSIKQSEIFWKFFRPRRASVKYGVLNARRKGRLVHGAQRRWLDCVSAEGREPSRMPDVISSHTYEWEA